MGQHEPTTRAEAQQYYRREIRQVLTDAARTDLDAGVWTYAARSQYWLLIGNEHALRFVRERETLHVRAEDIAQMTPQAMLARF